VPVEEYAERDRGPEEQRDGEQQPGDPGSGWIVPHFVQLVIQAPCCPPSIIGNRKPRTAPKAKAVSHFISGEHSERAFDQPLERLHQLRAVRAVDRAVVEAAGGDMTVAI
jgi:hypothetical protein